MKFTAVIWALQLCIFLRKQASSSSSSSCCIRRKKSRNTFCNMNDELSAGRYKKGRRRWRMSRGTLLVAFNRLHNGCSSAVGLKPRELTIYTLSSKSCASFFFFFSNFRCLYREIQIVIVFSTWPLATAAWYGPYSALCLRVYSLFFLASWRRHRKSESVHTLQ